MNVLHLFAGAGGGILADKLLGFRSVGYVENEPYCQAVLQARIQDGCIDPAPIFGDIREFIRAGHAREYQGFADMVAAGFPCQGNSVAGKRLGESDPRNLWPETIRVICSVRPRFAFLENVPGLLTARGSDGTRGGMFATILRDLAEAGFDAKWTVLGADDCGAPHRRKRLWILAESSGIGRREGWSESAGQQRRPDAPECGDVADSQGQSIGTGLCEDKPTGEWRGRSGDFGCSWWDTDPADLADTDGERRQQVAGGSSADEAADGRAGRDTRQPDGDHQSSGQDQVGRGRGSTQPRVGLLADELALRLDFARAAFGGTIPRVVTGIPHRVDRLRAIGNGQVSVCAAAAWHILGGKP